MRGAQAPPLAMLLAEWLKSASAEILRPGFNSLVGHRFYHTNILLNLAYQFLFSIMTKLFIIFFV